MSSYPILKLNLKKIRRNTKKIIQKCKEKNIQVAAVTKVFAGDIKVVKNIINSGVNILADSKLLNLKKFANFEIPKMLIRIPMQSELNELVKYTDMSLVSEIETVLDINRYANWENKVYEIILMIDVGDLREGIYYENIEEIEDFVSKVIKLNNIKLKGLGVNFSCFGGVRPSEEKFKTLINIKKYLEKKFNIQLDVLSGGSSGTLSLFDKIKIPDEVNQLRCGASIALGIGLDDMPFGYLYQDTCEFISPLVEIKEKHFNGIKRKIGICISEVPKLSKVDLIPSNKDLTVLDIDDNYIYLDITKSNRKNFLGDEIIFHLSYAGLLFSMTADNIKKIYIN
ncbi:hypothetical protein LN42_01445 [Marinitoga sp. 1137]|uniref:alanine racemase n=1 Tax=Marinitoga sp. 1137 TaxID=1545835 RepID=UPI000950A136|nr:alanine racemase [Marinitoga sp. 1137]APT75203.1 hypothetical protein LN42_01445 [Marinitoga sp. 1137]